MLREAAARTARIAEGVDAVAPGVLWMEATRTIVAADAHLAYEDVIGGALPTWSTTDAIAVLLAVGRTLGACEFLFLGDVIHGSRMSEGAARDVQDGLDQLRAVASVTLVAGNHEGRSRGVDVLGDTVEFAQRAGWTLIHGDRPFLALDGDAILAQGGDALLAEGDRIVCHGERAQSGAPVGPPLSSAPSERVSRGVILGHLHPTVRSNGTSAPAFLSSERVIVAPALTAYSEGLNVCSDDCFKALLPFGVQSRSELQVTATTAELVYRLGTLSALRQELRRPSPPQQHRYRRKILRPDR